MAHLDERFMGLLAPMGRRTGIQQQQERGNAARSFLVFWNSAPLRRDSFPLSSSLSKYPAYSFPCSSQKQRRCCLPLAAGALCCSASPLRRSLTLNPTPAVRPDPNPCTVLAVDSSPSPIRPVGELVRVTLSRPRYSSLFHFLCF